MFTKSAASRNAPFWILALCLLFLGSAARAQQFQDCEEALTTIGGEVTLADSTTTTQDKKVDEWNSDILKIGISEPGVLVVSGEGPEVQASLYAADSTSGPLVLVDGASLGTGQHLLAVAVQPGEHCVRVEPPANATGDLRLRATFFELSRLGLSPQ